MPRPGLHTHQSLLLGKPGLSCNEAQRGGVRMLVHLAEVVFQDLQLLLSGSHWLLCGHLLLGQDYWAKHCGKGLASLSKLGEATGAHLWSPRFAIPVPPSFPLPSGLRLQQGAFPFPMACYGSQLGAPAPQQLRPQFTTVAAAQRRQPAELSHHPSPAGNCSLSSVPALP